MSENLAVDMIGPDEIAPIMLLLGGGIMFVSSGITAYANILMKMDAMNVSRGGVSGFILSRRLVITAVSLYVIGGCSDLVALGLVPLSLRACASVLTIPFNAVLAKMCLNETMIPIQILGAGITVISAIGAMLFASQQGGGYDPTNSSNVFDLLLSEKMLSFVIWTVPIFFACLIIMFRHLPKPGRSMPVFSGAWDRVLVLGATTVAVSYQTGWTNLLIKCVAVLVQDGAEFTIGFWVLSALILISALGQMVLMSAMMRLFESVVVIPPYQILITLWLVMFSAVIFQEVPESIFGFTMCLLISFGGIVLVATPTSPTDTPAAQPLVPI
jgi:hypothetical protein